MASQFTALGQAVKYHDFVAPISINGTAATSTELDTYGWDFLEIIFMAGVIGAADFDQLEVTHSDTAGSGHTVPTGGAMTDPVQTDDGKMWRWFIDLRKYNKRYWNLNIDPGAVATLVACVGALRGPQTAPTTAAERGIDGQEIFLT